MNGTFTLNVRGTGSDGSTFSNHVTDHFNTTPTGAEFFFTHCHDDRGRELRRANGTGPAESRRCTRISRVVVPRA